MRAAVSTGGPQAYYANLKARLAKYGRAPDHMKIMPGHRPIGRTQRAEAQAKIRPTACAGRPAGRAGLPVQQFGDLSGYPGRAGAGAASTPRVSSIATDLWTSPSATT